MIKYLTRENTIIIFFSVLTYFLTYGQGLSGYIYNYDSVNRIFETENYTTFLSSGRPLRYVLEIFPGIGTMSPYIMFILTYSALIFTIYVVYNIFDIVKLSSKLAISAIVITFPILAVYWSFGNDIWIYAIALLCGSLSVYFAKENRFIWILCLTVLYLCNYQPVLSFAVSLYILFEMKQLIIGNFSSKLFIKRFGSIFLSTIIYVLLLKFLMLINGSQITEYLGADEISVISIVNSIPVNISYVYLQMLKLFTGNLMYLNATLFDNIYMLVVACSFGAPILLILKSGKKISILLYLLFLLTFPLFVNAALFATNIYFVRVAFGILTVLLAPFLLIYDDIDDFIIEITLTVITIIFIMSNIYTVNEMFTSARIKNELDAVVTQQIYNDLQKDSEYTKDDSISICGALTDNENISWRGNTQEFLGSGYFFDASPSAIYYFDTNTNDPDSASLKYESLFKLVGYNVEVVQSDCDKYEQSYPKEGYIKENKSGIFEIYLSDIEL